MKNIEQYKKRFFNLIESELGNVKPLINEQGYYGDLDTSIHDDSEKSFVEDYVLGFIKEIVPKETTPGKYKIYVVNRLGQEYDPSKVYSRDNVFKKTYSGEYSKMEIDNKIKELKNNGKY